jgi:hypothetical protein
MAGYWDSGAAAVFADHRAATTLRSVSDLSARVVPRQRAFPPLRPKATAAGFFFAMCASLAYVPARLTRYVPLRIVRA